MPDRRLRFIWLSDKPSAPKLLFFKDYDTTGDIFERIKRTYDPPLSLAEDFMVWNITQDEIRVRMAVVEEHTWSPALASPPIPPQMSDRAAMSEQLGWEIGYSDFIADGKWDVDDVLRPIYEEASLIIGREFPYPERENR